MKLVKGFYKAVHQPKKKVETLIPMYLKLSDNSLFILVQFSDK